MLLENTTNLLKTSKLTSGSLRFYNLAGCFRGSIVCPRLLR